MEILKFDALKKKKQKESKPKVTAGIQKPTITQGKAATLTCGSTGCCG